MGIPRNVVVVNDHCYINGGQAKVAIESSIGLAARGVKVYFFAACGPADQNLIDACERVVCLGQKDIYDDERRVRAAINGVWNFSAASKLKHLLSQFNAADTVVHCHGFAKALSPSIGVVLNNSELPQVFTMHEYFLACPNGGFYNYKREEICRLNALGAECLMTNCDSRRMSHKYWRVGRQVVSKVCGGLPGHLQNIIYISDVQREVMEQYLPSHIRLFKVDNPAGISDGERVSVESNDLFLYVGRLSAEKGVLDFVRAAEAVGVEAVLVGDGPLRATIEANYPGIQITGWMGSAEVSRWLEKARCLVFPSLWFETFGLVVWEALCRGVPVVCGEWSAGAELIRDGVTGVLYGNGKDKSLKQALIEMRNTERARSLSRMSYQVAQEEPRDLKRHVDALLEVYMAAGDSVTSNGWLPK